MYTIHLIYSHSNICTYYIVHSTIRSLSNPGTATQAGTVSIELEDNTGSRESRCPTLLLTPAASSQTITNEQAEIALSANVCAPSGTCVNDEER